MPGYALPRAPEARRLVRPAGVDGPDSAQPPPAAAPSMQARRLSVAAKQQGDKKRTGRPGSSLSPAMDSSPSHVSSSSSIGERRGSRTVDGGP